MKVQNMTTGKIAPMLITFALPLMAGNLFQELYTVVDTIIVGQFLGVTALAAVGNGGWITWMLTGGIQGFTQGFANPVAQAFGAKDEERVRKNMANSLVLTAVISIILLAIGEAAMVPLLKLLNTPEEIFDMSLLYLRIYYAGTPAIMAYNYAACHLRALGNSKDPLIAMVIASITNIVLDILFVGPLGMGVAGAVIATVISQFVAAAYSFVCLFKIDFVYLKKDKDEIDFLIETGKLKSEKHIRVVKFLQENDGTYISDLEALTDVSRAVFKTMEKNGIIEIIEQQIERNPFATKNIENDEPHELTDEQKKIFDAENPYWAEYFKERT